MITRALIVLSSVVGGLAGASPLLDERLQVVVRADAVQLQVTLVNRGALPIRVPKSIAEDEEPENGHVFELLDVASGAAVPYTGMLVKRGAPTAADYLTLPPHGRRRHRIELGRSYVLVPGRAYVVRHHASYLLPGQAPQQANPAGEAQARFIR